MQNRQRLSVSSGFPPIANERWTRPGRVCIVAVLALGRACLEVNVDTVAKAGFRFGRLLLWLVLIVIAGLAAWTMFTLSWAYSEGDRAGVLQKFSKKGWLCKTYEGELALYIVGGVAPQIWQFSTRDEALAKELGAAVGKNIQLHYTEHRGVPTQCFAETPYFARSFVVQNR
jgi:hypothetical protein